MKDIDFEELDRAVSSVLGTKEEDAPTVALSEVSEPSAVQPEDEKPATNETTVSASEVMKSPKNLVQKRSSGRFMDVVHPSSDMKVQSKPSISRQGVSVVSPVASPSLSDTPPGSKQPPVEQPDKPVEESIPAADDMHTLPDPLDFHGFNAQEEPKEDTDSIHETADHDLALQQAASELAEMDSLMGEPKETPPLDTPFVNDLAVEKRPLGAFSLGATDTSLLKADVVGDISPADEGHSQEVTDKEVNTEMDNVPEDHDTSEPEEKQEIDAQTSPADIETIPEELHEDVVAVESREIEVTPAAPATLAGGSIPLQYKEQPSTQPGETTPVFDTNDYHQPLRHIEKKKSGWLGVVLIIFLVLIGTAGGAAVYFFDPFGLF